MAKPNYAALLASIGTKTREIETIDKEIVVLDAEITDLNSKINDGSRDESLKVSDRATKNTKETQKTTKQTEKTTKEATKQVDILACYVFTEKLTKEEEDLFNYVSEDYLVDNPGTTTAYIGKYYGENGELQ